MVQVQKQNGKASKRQYNIRIQEQHELQTLQQNRRGDTRTPGICKRTRVKLDMEKEDNNMVFWRKNSRKLKEITDKEIHEENMTCKLPQKQNKKDEGQQGVKDP